MGKPFAECAPKDRIYGLMLRRRVGQIVEIEAKGVGSIQIQYVSIGSCHEIQLAFSGDPELFKINRLERGGSA